MSQRIVCWFGGLRPSWKKVAAALALSVVLPCAALAGEWTWYENDRLPLGGVGFKDAPTRFCRLPARAQGVVRDPIWHMSSNTTGLYLRFRAFSKRLRVEWTVANSNATDVLIPQAGLIGIDVYRQATNGWQFVGNKRYFGNGGKSLGPGVAEFGWISGEAGMILLPIRAIVTSLRVGVEEGGRLEPLPFPKGHEKPVVHYGTSIVHGGCASRPGLAFTSIAQRELDRDYINLGFSGNGRMEVEVAPFLAEIDAAVYVVDCVWNMAPKMIGENGVKFLKELKRLKPDVPILLCEGCNSTMSRMDRNVAMRKVYDELKESDPETWRNLYYFSDETMLRKGDLEQTHDFCHPNDSGMRVMGPAYAKRIREVLEADAALGAKPSVTVDFAEKTGPVKPVNGVGQPPITGHSDTGMFWWLKKAGIPCSRLHDVGGVYGRNLFVDIPNIFRDFNADETKAENYDFFYTDKILKGLVDNGVEPFFRLGVTIEWSAIDGKCYRADPPKDYAKWARIAEHVIRHYTEGWANGYKWKMTRWSIWNEPENHPDPKQNPLWRAPFETYVDFYAVVARHLKDCFPHLKIGGYGSSGFYSAAKFEADPGAKVATQTDCFIRAFNQFFDRVKRDDLPIDFYTMHSYSMPAPALEQIRACRRMLDAKGFKDLPISFNEWEPSPTPEKVGTAKQAAEIAAELAGLQNLPDVADACIYDARCGLGLYSPLFDPVKRAPRPAYWSFVAFNELRKLGTAVRISTGHEGLWATAATDGKDRGAILVANISGRALPLDGVFGDWKVVKTTAISPAVTYRPVTPDGTIADDTVLLVELTRKVLGQRTGELENVASAPTQK